MVNETAVIALVISFGSFAFSVYQYRILHLVRVAEKSNLLIRFACDLRRKLEDLKHKADVTDNVDDENEFIQRVSLFVEEAIARIASANRISIDELLRVEKSLLSLELEVDLMYKQVSEVARFNTEDRATNFS